MVLVRRFREKSVLSVTGRFFQTEGNGSAVVYRHLESEGNDTQRDEYSRGSKNKGTNSEKAHGICT